MPRRVDEAEWAQNNLRMRLRRLLVVALPVVLTSIVGAIPAQAALPSPRADAVAVSGYNFEANQIADVVAGDHYAALRLTYTAARPITDATIRIVMSRAEWPTTLTTRAAFTGESPFDPVDRGVVSVLPNTSIPGPADSCRGTGAGGAFADSDWSVQSSSRWQVIQVTHATCTAGAQLVVRTKGLTDPPRPGIAVLPLLVEQNGRWTQLAFGRVHVRPTPKVVLHLETPDRVLAGDPFHLSLSATSTDPVAAQAYHGSVAVASDPVDCSQDPHASTVIAQVSVNTGNVVTLALSGVQTSRLRAYDVANRAVPSVTAPFQVLPSGKFVVCPASFH